MNKMRWLLVILIICIYLHITTAVQINEYANRISYPHLYPGQNITSTNRFFEEPLRPGTSTVRWTEYGSYSINLDKIHSMRESYTLILRSKKGPDIRMLPFETTKIYLAPEYYGIRYDKNTKMVWMKKYSD